MFLQAMEGYRNVQGRTHEDTNKVTYALAEFYIQEFRQADADKIPEDLTQERIRQWGYEHRRTVQHILYTAELFDGWNRPNDALALLASSTEVTKAPSRTKRPRPQRRTRRSAAKATPRLGVATSSVIENISNSLIDNTDPTRIDVGLGLARARVIAKDEATKSFLEAIISRCELDDQNLANQNLRARGELLNLYTMLDERTNERASTAIDAKRAFQRIWNYFEWDEDKFQCIEVMEAGMQLAARMLKAGFASDTIALFRDVTDKATTLFGSDDERFIWISITIGLAYQKYRDWEEAQDWFEQAYAGALSNEDMGPKDGIVKSLEHAMKNRHFTYVSDEGRPYRTMFGISGTTIRPGRLHLD